jgi:antitoxin HicB
MNKSKRPEWLKYITQYEVDIKFDPSDKIYVASVPELPGCMTHGDTQIEALKMAHEAIEAYLESRAKRGLPIPEPLAVRNFSGKIPLRIDPTLHRDLTAKSEIEGKSLNSFIEEKLRKI